MSITYIDLQPSQSTAIRNASPCVLGEVVDSRFEIRIGVGVVVESSVFFVRQAVPLSTCGFFRLIDIRKEKHFGIGEPRGKWRFEGA